MSKSTDLRALLVTIIIISGVIGGIILVNILFPPKSLEEIWTDMIKNRQSAISTLPTYTSFAENATTWQEYANKCIDAFLTYDDCWTYGKDNEDNITGFRAYVKNAHGWMWPEGYRNITELMAGIDVLWPLYRYLQLHPNSTRQTMVDMFINELPKYFNPEVNQSINRPGETRHDSWYFMENSVWKYGHLFKISNISLLKNPYFSSLSSALQAAANFNYLFPQFFDLDLKQVGSENWNYCTAGLLAYSLIDAYELCGELTFLQEAMKCLIAMRKTKPFELLYEPQELGCASAAAARLLKYSDKLNTTIDFGKMASEFFYAQEQLLYTNGGKCELYLIQARPWRDGLHTPFFNWAERAGIEPPAYKECIESIMIWLEYLKYLYFSPYIIAEEPLKVLNLNRIKMFDFFSPNIPDTNEREYGPKTLQYIPYEDVDEYYIHPHEDNSYRYKAGFNGKEIYGSGETIWLYLMFEALGVSTDRNALMVNLNIFDTQYPPLQEDRLFIIWNPYFEEKNLEFIPKKMQTTFNLYINNSLIPYNSTINEFLPGDSFSVNLPPKGSALVSFKPFNYSLNISPLRSITPFNSISSVSSLFSMLKIEINQAITLFNTTFTLHKSKQVLIKTIKFH